MILSYRDIQILVHIIWGIDTAEPDSDVNNRMADLPSLVRESFSRNENESVVAKKLLLQLPMMEGRKKLNRFKAKIAQALDVCGQGVSAIGDMIQVNKATVSRWKKNWRDHPDLKITAYIYGILRAKGEKEEYILKVLELESLPSSPEWKSHSDYAEIGYKTSIDEIEKEIENRQPSSPSQQIQREDVHDTSGPTDLKSEATG